VANNWLIRPDPLEDLAKLHTVSLCAHEFGPVVIGLHIDVHPEISLRTRDQLSAERHRQTTPRFSSVTREAAPMLGLGPLAATSGLIQQAGAFTQAPPPVDPAQQAHSATTMFMSLNSSYPPPEYPRFGSLQHQLPPHLPTHALLYSPPAIPVYSVPSVQHSQPARSLVPAFGVAAQPPAALAAGGHSRPY
jgi:hypothetical protein